MPKADKNERLHLSSCTFSALRWTPPDPSNLLQFLLTGCCKTYPVAFQVGTAALTSTAGGNRCSHLVKEIMSFCDSASHFHADFPRWLLACTAAGFAPCWRRGATKSSETESKVFLQESGEERIPFGPFWVLPWQLRLPQPVPPGEHHPGARQWAQEGPCRGTGWAADPLQASREGTSLRGNQLQNHIFFCFSFCFSFSFFFFHHSCSFQWCSL